MGMDRGWAKAPRDTPSSCTRIRARGSCRTSCRDGCRRLRSAGRRTGWRVGWRYCRGHRREGAQEAGCLKIPTDATRNRQRGRGLARFRWKANPRNRQRGRGLARFRWKAKPRNRQRGRGLARFRWKANPHICRVLEPRRPRCAGFVVGVVFLLTMPPAIELLSQRALPTIGIFVPIVSLGYAFPRLRALLLRRGSQRVLEDPRTPGGLPHRLPLDDFSERPPINVPERHRPVVPLEHDGILRRLRNIVGGE